MAKKSLYLAVQDALAKGYVATPDGQIFGPRGKKIGTDQGTGYITIGFKDAGGEHHGPYAHRFIWMALVGDIPPGYDINHKKQPKSNNSLDNLECIPHVENMRHTAKMGQGGGGRGVVRRPSVETLEDSIREKSNLIDSLWEMLKKMSEGKELKNENYNAMEKKVLKELKR
jgi:HNH endonuclease